MLSSFLLIILSVSVYGIIHSVLASVWVKERARTLFGPPVERWYRFVYNLFATVTLLPVIALPALLPDKRLYTIPSPWVYLSIAGQLTAVIIVAVGLLHTGVWSFLGFRQMVEGKEPATGLVIKGLYRYVRHPLYTAGLAFIWLAPVMTVNLLALNLGLTLYLVLGALFEERKLRQEFGRPYAEYQARVPMLLPRLPPKE